MGEQTRIEQQSGRRAGPDSRRWRALRTALIAGFAAIAAVTVLAPSGAVHADDGDLRLRLEAACARIPAAATRVQAAIDRLDAPASDRGSLAWFEAAIDRAEGNDRPRIAADLQRRLDRLVTRRATLDERSAQLDRFAVRCSELGAAA